jgi:hypothetical protein
MIKKIMMKIFRRKPVTTDLDILPLAYEYRKGYPQGGICNCTPREAVAILKASPYWEKTNSYQSEFDGKTEFTHTSGKVIYLQRTGRARDNPYLSIINHTGTKTFALYGCAGRKPS